MGWLRMCVWRGEFTENEKCHNLMSWLILFYNGADYMDRVKRIWYVSPMRAAKVQASLRIRAVSPEPSLLTYTSSESRGAFRQKARSLAPLDGWACAVKICHHGMLEDTNSLDGDQLFSGTGPLGSMSSFWVVSSIQYYRYLRIC